MRIKPLLLAAILPATLSLSTGNAGPIFGSSAESVGDLEWNRV